MDANEQKARELRDQYCPAGNYEYSDVLDAIMAALDMKPALSKPKVQTEHLWCTNCEGVHPESCFNATPRSQQVPADGEWVLVPREATDEMISAGVFAHRNDGYRGMPMHAAWAAMVAASPPLAASRAEQEPQP